MPRLNGERVCLREYRGEDLSAIASWLNDADVTRYLSTRYWIPQTECDARDYLNGRMQSSHSAYYYVIADRNTGEYLGQADLYSVDWRLRCATLGMIVTRPGEGIGTEALRLLCRFAFQTLGMERIEAEAHEDNQAALRCYEKAGFIREGVKRKAFFNDGAFHDVVMMSSLRDEWK